MKLKLNNLSSYEVKEQRALSDIHSEGAYLIHKKSGARICVISNDDENKVFFVGFRTPPADSTGVPHIIEHTVLCGSEKFPVKDPFIELVKGSMNTFLNAMTYPDKTMYPVASCNDKDFQNLMDVYMDSVFSPNIYKEPNIFRQEGWHYELEKPEDDLTLNGVVYNEMKGAFSSADGVLEREILNTLFPDTPYCNESGGDPDVIPELTYEQFLDFHRRYYHPSNSYIYLYGNMDVEEKLRWLDEEYLGKYEYTPVDSQIPYQQPFEQPIEKERYYSISSSESEENSTYLSYSWAIGTNLDREQYIAFDVLDYALLSTQGAPIKQALLDAGIGDDIYGGYDSGTYQPVFSIIAKNANLSQKDKFDQIIRDVLTEQVKNGINKKTLLAAINGSEFKFREADFGRFPKGLMFGIQVMDSWLYDDEAAFRHLDELQVYETLREKLDTDYFEQLIQKYLLENTHAAAVRIVPKKGLNAEKEKALKDRLQAYKASLSPEEIDILVAETKALRAYQEEPSTKEQLERIPLLTREDMKKESVPYSNIVSEVNGTTLLWHDYFSNGVIYLDLIFDVHHIPEELVPYMAILKQLLGKLDTEEYGYTDFSDEVNLYTGGIYSDLNVYSDMAEDNAYQAKYEVRMKVLEGNLDKAIALAKSMMLHTLWKDEKRIYEILAQAKSRIQTELSESGHVISATRALSYQSLRAKYADLIHGIGCYRVLEEIVQNFDTRKKELVEKLEKLLSVILQSGNLLVSCTCAESGMELVREKMPAICEGLYPDTERTAVDISLPTVKNEGFMDASQIQYVSLAGNFLSKGYEYTGVLRIFKSIMSYDYLWQHIRVKGGAYGCGCNVSRTGEIYFASYRDPNLSKTLETYRKIPEYLDTFDVDERTMTRFVVGTFSEMDAPLTPMSQGRRSLLAWLTGITYDMIQKDRTDVLQATCDDIRNLSGLLRAALEQSDLCAIGNEEKLKQEKELFEHLEPLSGK